MDVASIVGVPSFVLGVGEYNQRAWNNFIQNKIRPMCVAIAQELTKKLILSPKMYLKFNTWSLLDWDLQTVSNVYGGLSDRGIVMMENLCRCGHKCEWSNHKNRAGSIRLDITEKGKPNPLRDALRQIGVWNNKHIPDIYLQASVRQRLDLLQGLMDTDGTCSIKGECEFTQKSELLSKQVFELVCSLGMRGCLKTKKAKCNGKDAGIVYRIHFYTDFFQLRAKFWSKGYGTLMRGLCNT